MRPKVNIIALVDVIGALSDRTLQHGNLCLVDDSGYEGTGQGTAELCTLVLPGQVVEWTALAVDVQTPLVIRGITFLAADGSALPAAPAPDPAAGQDAEPANPDALVWSGVVPATLVPGQPYRYQLDLQMDQGRDSILSTNAPALMCPQG
jgi:hypothetical protein